MRLPRGQHHVCMRISEVEGVKMVTIKDLASFLGISRRQVFRLKKEGVFEDKGGYDLQACTQAYVKKLKAKKERPTFECPKEWGDIPTLEDVWKEQEK